MRFHHLSPPALFALIVGSTLSFCSALHAAELNTTSSIQDITIFPGSAKVTRVATLNIPSGESTLEIRDLPLNLIQTSLRISGESVNDVTLGSITLKNKINTEWVLEKERVLRQQIDDLNQQRREHQDKIKRQQSQLEYISAMGSGGNSDMGSRYLQLPMAQWKEALKTLDEATAEAQQTIRNTNIQLAQLDIKLKKLNNELRQVASNQRSTRVAHLSLNASSDTSLAVKISYLINGASWTPVYDADLNTHTNQLTIKTQAEIRQRTGENWQGATVTLSTLRPSESSQLAILQPWPIDFAPEFSGYPSAASKSMIMDAEVAPLIEADVAVRAAPAAPRKRNIRREESTLVSADFSAEYKIPKMIDLDSGSQKKRFSLSTKSYESNVVLAATPRLDPRVLLTSNFKYEGKTPLLAGSLSLYRDGNYVGQAHLNQQQPGQEVKLSFGEDDNVKLTFQPDPDAKSEDGIFFGKRKAVKRAYQITMSNQHDKTFTIHLYDNIPVASHEDINVELSGVKPSEQDIDDKKGVMLWERTLAPSSKQQLNYGYRVSYPKDKTVFGFE